MTGSGTLYGVGLGPGDPELLTLKAHRLIVNAKAVAYPAPDDGPSFARAIAADFIPSGAKEIPIIVPMRVERYPAKAVYDKAAAEIASVLEGGEDVVTLCEGDPFFYGSFMYLFERLSRAFRLRNRSRRHVADGLCGAFEAPADRAKRRFDRYSRPAGG